MCLDLLYIRMRILRSDFFCKSIFKLLMLENCLVLERYVFLLTHWFTDLGRRVWSLTTVDLMLENGLKINRFVDKNGIYL